MSASTHQCELNFDQGGEDGMEAWKQARKEAVADLARQMGIPLGTRVEVWLRGQIRLRGIVTLRESFLLLDGVDSSKLALEVDKVPFTFKDMESCVRMD